MFEVIREWPRYVKVPFPIAKVRIEQKLFHYKIKATMSVCFSFSVFALRLQCFPVSAVVKVGLLLRIVCEWFQAIATPREILLNKVPFPLPNPDIFNLDQILAQTTDTVVSENGNTNKI